jgi:hypothetical protein
MEQSSIITYIPFDGTKLPQALPIFRASAWRSVLTYPVVLVVSSLVSCGYVRLYRSKRCEIDQRARLTATGLLTNLLLLIQTCADPTCRRVVLVTAQPLGQTEYTYSIRVEHTFQSSSDILVYWCCVPLLTVDCSKSRCGWCLSDNRQPFDINAAPLIMRQQRLNHNPPTDPTCRLILL